MRRELWLTRGEYFVIEWPGGYGRPRVAHLDGKPNAGVPEMPLWTWDDENAWYMATRVMDGEVVATEIT